MSRRLSCAVTALALVLSLSAATALADTDHGTMPVTTHRAPKGMTVALRIAPDAMKGWNLQAKTRAFRWAPEHASSMHRPGEGHAHLYIDGVKVTRLYGAWHYLGSLAPGHHEIKVTLNGNDHGDYVRGGRAVAATAVVTVPAT